LSVIVLVSAFRRAHSNNDTVQTDFVNGTLHIDCQYQEPVLSFPKGMWDNLLETVYNLSSQSNIETINITSCHVMDEGIRNLLSQSWARKVTTLYISNYMNETITFPGDLLHGLLQLKNLTLNNNVKEISNITFKRQLFLPLRDLVYLDLRTSRHWTRTYSRICRICNI